MRLTKKQKETILPLLQTAVQAQIDRWETERLIEGIVGKEMDSMQKGIEDLAVGADRGTDVKLEDVQGYIDSCDDYL